MAKQKDFRPLINARIETIDEKVSFKKLIKTTRCVAVMDGFYAVSYTHLTLPTS